MNPSPLGYYLRASRLGYHWSKKHGAWIRISIRRDGVIRVDVASPIKIIPGSDRVGEHVVWWENSDHEMVLDMCQPLKDVRNPQEHKTFIVDNFGNEQDMGNKYLRVTMPDGTKWDVPVMAIANNRAEYYAKEDDEFDGSFTRSLKEDTLPLFEEDDYEIGDWAANNMNWEDVSHLAVKASDTPEPDYQKGWVNGGKEIVDKKPKGQANE